MSIAKQKDMTPAIRATLFDVDGTLVPMGAAGPSPVTVDALRRLHARGIKVVLATGRRLGFLAHVTEPLGFEPDAIVAANGQHCMVGRRCVREVCLSRGDACRAWDYLTSERVYAIWAEAQESFANLPKEACRYVWDGETNQWPTLPKERRERGRAIQIVTSLPAAKPRIERELVSLLEGSRVTRWHDMGADVIPVGGGKGLGAQTVAAELGLSPCELIAFGDGQNDLDLFAEVGTSVAMGDGDPRLQAAATLVTEPAAQDGVARALERLGLI